MATLNDQSAMAGDGDGLSAGSPGRRVLLAVIIPILLAVAILAADLLEGPKTAYVGVLTVVPMLAAVFGTPRQTALVGVITWLSAFGFGLIAVDGQNEAQTVRLVIIALLSVIAVFAARLRERRDGQLVLATREAAAARELRAMSQTDELTGLLNRRGALERIAVERTEVWTVAIVDCDGLKQVNDELGHQAGDDYLEAIAGRFAAAVSSSDILARWGGDEFFFAIALPVNDAVRVLERARSAVTRNPVSTGAGPVAAAVSVGACEWLPGQDLDSALQRADAALYRAKGEGGDRVVTG